jgi:hypothetical protein
MQAWALLKVVFLGTRPFAATRAFAISLVEHTLEIGDKNV